MTKRNNKTVFFLYAILALLLMERCSAYTGVIPADEEHPGKCVYRGDELKLGVHPISPCQQLTCLEDGSIMVEGCGRVRIEDCNRGERMNTEKAYPECCWLRYKCQNRDGSHYYIERSTLENDSTT